MANPNIPGKYYDIKLDEEVFLHIEQDGTTTLIYAESGVMKNTSQEYIDKNLIKNNIIADTLFDDDSSE